LHLISIVTMDIIGKARVILGEEHVPGRGLRRPVDLLITKIAPGIILLLSFVITANKLFKKPVDCYLEAAVANWPSFAESQCWVQGPYYNKDYSVPKVLNPEDRLTYMAYLPYIFAFASLILFAPYFIFSLIMKPLSTKFEAIYSGCDMISNQKDEQTLNNIKERICDHLVDLTADRKYIIIFMVARFIYITSLFMVALFFSAAFRANFFTMGFRSVFFFYGLNQEFVNTRFPLVGLCRITVREMRNGGSKNVYFSQCNLPNNLLLSKAYGIVYVLLFFICLPLAVFDTFHIFGYFLCHRRSNFNTKALVMRFLEDSVKPSVYGEVKTAYQTRVVRMKYAEYAKSK